jgi:hypothetical protein
VPTTSDLSRPRRARPLLVFAFLLSLSCSAGAQPSPDAAFQEGLRHYEAKSYAAATEVWERLLVVVGEEKSGKVLYNLGLAYEAAGDATRALDRFEAFGRWVDKRPSNEQMAKKRAEAEGRVKAIKASHGAILVTPPASGALVLVRIGPLLPRPAGTAVWMRPGRYEVEIGAGTSFSRTTSCEVRAGEVAEIPAKVPTTPAPPPPPEVASSVAPPPPASAAPPAAIVPPEPKTRFPTVEVVVLGSITLASVAVPLFLRSAANDRRDDAEALGVTSSRYPRARNDFDESRNLYYASIALPAAFAALTIGVSAFYRPARKATLSGFVLPDGTGGGARGRIAW